MTHSAHRTAAPRQQQGVVLFIALIAMVVLSLAGVALIRAVDTTGSVAGNIAFREASIPAVNLAIERAVDALYVSKLINQEQDDVAHRYFAKLQAGEKPNGLPAVLSGTYSTMTGAYPFGAPETFPAGGPTGNAEVRTVIERVCDPAAPIPAPPGALTFPQKLQYCDQLAPKLSVAKTSMKLTGPTLPPFPLFRVTVRVDLPGTNTAAYAQAMLH
jgi:type IV pilus assembly protein PilX